MTLYKYVLHHPGNSFDKWFLELLGTYVSYLNECSYCFEHHYAGMARIIGDDEKSNSLAEAIHQGKLAHAEHLSEKERALVGYAYKLTLHPTDITIADIDMLQHHGADDGEILEINQVVAYFAYANRTVMGLGINTSGDIIGLSPNDNDDPDNWSHQ